MLKTSLGDVRTSLAPLYWIVFASSHRRDLNNFVCVPNVPLWNSPDVRRSPDVQRSPVSGRGCPDVMGVFLSSWPKDPAWPPVEIAPFDVPPANPSIVDIMSYSQFGYTYPSSSQVSKLNNKTSDYSLFPVIFLKSMFFTWILQPVLYHILCYYITFAHWPPDGAVLCSMA